jgi:predicted amidophosphoribosyltransferase
MDIKLKEVHGNWAAGYALDKHTVSSTFDGYDDNGHPKFTTIRTEVGEATYQLKYRQDWTKTVPLAQEIHEKIIPELGVKIGFVVPMPASNERERQPVTEVANEVAKLLNVPCFDGMLTKTKGQSLKNLHTKEEKIQALEGTFSLNELITNNGKWNVLVVDDLFDSGATMEAACSKLRSYNKVNNVYVATLTWK